MGDRSTHIIFYQGYWALVWEDDEKNWIETNQHDVICRVGEEEKIMQLSEIN